MRVFFNSSNDASLPVNILLTVCGMSKCLFVEINDAIAAAD